MAETFSLRIYPKDPNTVCPKNPGFPPDPCLFQSGWEAGFPKNIRSWILLDQRWVRNFSYLQPSHGGPCGSSFMVAKHLRKKNPNRPIWRVVRYDVVSVYSIFYRAFIHPRWCRISSIMGSCDIFSPRQLAWCRSPLSYFSCGRFRISLTPGVKQLRRCYSLSHNHGSGKYLYLKGNYYWRDPFLTSMIMGGSVVCFCHSMFFLRRCFLWLLRDFEWL